MNHTLIRKEIVDRIVSENGISDFGKATIREIVSIVNQIEKESQEKFIRMEMGVPGLPAPLMGVNAQIKALQSGVASIYPVLDGLPALKEEASRFIKAFIDIDIRPKHCIPVVGSMQGTYASFLVAGQCKKDHNKVLFIDPGFPVQKQQLDLLGYPYDSFDLYHFRGKALEDKLEEMLSQGGYCALIYSNPNNPSWVCLQEEELQVIGEKANQYDVLVIEDLAYFAMDFRKTLSHPFQPPYQATVARYTPNYILLISASKAFSYAGERIGIAAISDSLFDRPYPYLNQRYGVETFGGVFVGRALYGLSSGVDHSAQYALTEMMKAASEGHFNFLDTVKEYGRRAGIMKGMFLSHGFELVYDNDMGQSLADGFYFTLTYPSMTGGELAQRLLYYGISAIPLDSTGSQQQGLRACTSFIGNEQFPDLEERLTKFEKDFSSNS